MNAGLEYEVIHRRGAELMELTQSKKNIGLTLRELRKLRSSAVNELPSPLR
jgi:hypothetical protein